MISRDFYLHTDSNSHSTSYSSCFWCKKYCKYEGVSVKRGLVNYMLPYCSRKCYNDDPYSTEITEQFISDCKQWSKIKLKEERERRAAREKQNEKNRIQEEADWKKQQQINLVVGCLGIIFGLLTFYFMFKKETFAAAGSCIVILIMSFMTKNKKHD
jgi:hypothetical protein